MSKLTLLQSIKEARRDALVSHYMAHGIPEKLKDRITNADTLYDYLLLDTKISHLVTTSPIAEAINSLQLYINRCVEGHEGVLTTEGNSHFEPGKFLNHWDTYNRRYATWAGKERLKYYAGSYIDPSLRRNKTDLFLSLEQSISQGRLTNNSVHNALKTYLNEYDTLTNLEYISVNKGNDEDVLFFVGRTTTAPYAYYWRRFTLRSNSQNMLIPDTWSQWQKITANIGEAVANHVNIYWHNNRLHVQWQTVETSQGNNNEATNITYMNDWVMNSSEIWSSFHKSRNTTFQNNHGSI